MQLTLEKQETQTVDLQKLVDGIGQYVRFRPDYSFDVVNKDTVIAKRDKDYEVLGKSKRYKGEVNPFDSIVTGVLVAITCEDGREHRFGHEWFLENSSDYEIDN